MKSKNHKEAEAVTVEYHIPRRDVWYADLSEEARRDILSLPTRMDSKDALRYILNKYHKKISQASYYRAISRLNGNRLASTLLKAVETPPALDYLKRITETVQSIDTTLKSMLANQK